MIRPQPGPGAFLADAAFRPLWMAAAAALDRNGLDWRGRLALPELPPEGRRRLGVLLDRPVPVGRRTVPLADIATAVERLTGAGLIEVLAVVGCAPTGRREAARARFEGTRQRQAAFETATEEHLGGADWAAGWQAAAWTDGLLAHRTPDDVAGLVRAVAAVLRCSGSGRSRSEVAAQVCGDAHALDASTRLTALATRALVARDGPAGERGAWERAGMPLDLVSAPVLTWNLPLLGASGPAAAAAAMTAAALPFHASVLAIRGDAPAVAVGTPVLVVENPRLVEAAAQRRLAAAVLCTNGNPTTAPSELIARLRESGAALRYHGDFDSAGLAMTGRAQIAGCAPFLMSVADYLDALDAARTASVDLPRDQAPPPLTPWDPALATAFDARREIVHEERVMDAVLTAHASRS